MLFQAILKNIQADDDKLVSVGKWLLRKLKEATVRGKGRNSDKVLVTPSLECVLCVEPCAYDLTPCFHMGPLTG